MRDYSWGASWMLYCAYVSVGAMYIFVNFSLSHTHLPVSETDEYYHWVEYGAKFTTNIARGPFGFVDWWMAYLNYQIEHHLFPSMPQFRHPLVAPRVKEMFEKHGLTHDTRGYFECLQCVLGNMDEAGQVAWNSKSEKKPEGKKL